MCVQNEHGRQLVSALMCGIREQEIFCEKFNSIFFLVVLTIIHDNDVEFPLLPTNTIMSPSNVIPYKIRELINLKLTDGSALLKQNHFRKGMLLFSMFYATDFTEWFFFCKKAHSYHHLLEIFELL